MKRIAAAHWALISPSVVFFLALFARSLLPAQDPANGPQWIVTWYASHQWTLWIFLIALPLSALLVGGAALLQAWTTDESLRDDAKRLLVALRSHLSVCLTGVGTVAAVVVLSLVAFHLAAT